MTTQIKKSNAGPFQKRNYTRTKKEVKRGANKTTVISAQIVRDILKEVEYQGKTVEVNPIIEMAWTSLKCKEVIATLLANEDFSKANFYFNTKQKADAELANYIHAKLSAVKSDVTAQVDVVSIEQIREEIVEQLTNDIIDVEPNDPESVDS